MDVFDSPLLNKLFGFGHGAEDFPVEVFVPELVVKTFNVTILWSEIPFEIPFAPGALGTVGERAGTEE